MCRLLQSLDQTCSQSNSVSEGEIDWSFLNLYFFTLSTWLVHTLDKFQIETIYFIKISVLPLLYLLHLHDFLFMFKYLESTCPCY